MNFVKYINPTNIKDNIHLYLLLFISLFSFLSGSYALYLNASFSPTISYTVTDRIDGDGECAFRSTWSTGMKRTDRSDVFGCKERETQLNKVVYVQVNSQYEYENTYGGVLPWYIGTGIVMFWAVLAIVGLVCSIFTIVEIKINVD